MNYLLVKIGDEVTVSSLPHPISMFLLGIFAVAIIFMLIEVNRSRKEVEKLRHKYGLLINEVEKEKNAIESKLNEVSKKVDSRVDKALLTFKKQNKLIVE